MTPNTHIPTDLLTPLGAYLRLREGATASFLLESVEQGRLGRHSFIGSGSRLVSFEEAEELRRAGRRLPRLRPRREAGADGAAARRTAPASPRAASSSPRRSSASTTAAARPRCSRAIRPRSRRGSRRELVLQEHKSPPSGRRCGASPTRPTYEDGVRRIKELIRAGDAFQVVLSQRAERHDVGLGARSSTGRCGASTPRRTSSCSSSTGSR